MPFLQNARAAAGGGGDVPIGIPNELEQHWGIPPTTPERTPLEPAVPDRYAERGSQPCRRQDGAGQLRLLSQHR